MVSEGGWARSRGSSPRLPPRCGSAACLGKHAHLATRPLASGVGRIQIQGTVVSWAYISLDEAASRANTRETSRRPFSPSGPPALPAQTKESPN